jgi:hypothetical protein
MFIYLDKHIPLFVRMAWSFPKFQARTRNQDGRYFKGYTPMAARHYETLGSQFPSDNEDEDKTYDQPKLTQRLRKGRRPDTASGAKPGHAGIV